MAPFPKPPQKSIVYEDANVGICLATHPFAPGHTIVFWKKPVKDIHILSCQEYENLMHIIDVTREALLKTYKTKKVYLLYMDELQQVHWHLVPRIGTETGFALFKKELPKMQDFSIVEKIRENFLKIQKQHPETISHTPHR